MPPSSRPSGSGLSRTERLELAVAACDLIADYLTDIDESAFFSPRPVYRDAICLRIQEVAEMLKPIDDEDDSLRHDIPEAGSLFGMRNIIAHRYRVIDPAVAWNVATVDIPVLRERLQRLLDHGHA